MYVNKFICILFKIYLLFNEIMFKSLLGYKRNKEIKKI